MAMVRWDPAHELAGMEIDRLNRMFSDFAESFGRGWTPPVDIFETDNNDLVLQAELPDLTREDIKLTFENNVLTLKGERKFNPETKREKYQRLERHYGTFTRSFTLPATIDASRISAWYKDGILTVRMPQREEARPKQISIGAE